MTTILALCSIAAAYVHIQLCSRERLREWWMSGQFVIRNLAGSQGRDMDWEVGTEKVPAGDYSAWSIGTP